MVKRSSKPKKTAKKVDIYPYRVLYLVIVISVISLVMLAYLGVSNDY